MNTSLLQTLTKAGLDPITAQVYLALVELGETRITPVEQKTQLSSASVYEAFSTLLAEGYIEYRKEGRVAYYKPVHPQKLEELVQQKKRDVALLEGEMGETIRSLSGIFNLAFHKPGVKFFEGIDGLKEMYLDTLEESEPIYALLSPAAADPKLADWLNKTYAKKRVEKNIHASVIAPESEQTKIYTGEDKKFLRETRIIPSGQFPVQIEIDMYGKNKVAFISYKKEEMFGVLLSSPAIYLSMKTFFLLSWNAASQFTQPTQTVPPPSAAP